MKHGPITRVLCLLICSAVLTLAGCASVARNCVYRPSLPDVKVLFESRADGPYYRVTVRNNSTMPIGVFDNFSGPDTANKSQSVYSHEEGPGFIRIHDDNWKSFSANVNDQDGWWSFAFERSTVPGSPVALRFLAPGEVLSNAFPLQELVAMMPLAGPEVAKFPESDGYLTWLDGKWAQLRVVIHFDPEWKTSVYVVSDDVRLKHENGKWSFYPR